MLAQLGCPACEINLPTLPEDTIFISELPDGVLGEYYEADVSFRLPKTTTPVAETDTTLLPGLNIDEIVILGLIGLPEGLSWEVSQDTFNVREMTDGCARICGVPQTRGAFRLEILLTSQLFVINRESSAFLDLFIAPPTSATDGFSMENGTGCGASRVSFRNNNPSLGEEGFQYFWDFGNGKTSTAENPEPQDYVTPGEYEVTYQAIIDTAESRLRGVTILEGDCSDIIGRPDYYISIINPEGEEIYVARHLENPILPVTFDLNILLEENGTYLLHVNDEDSGLEGSDDNCAIIPFTVQDSLLDFEGVRATLDISSPIDTILARDTVFIFPFPASPSVAVSGETNLCFGETTLLEATPYEDNLQWSRDGQAIPNARGNSLTVTTSGRYTVTYTSPNGGCTVVAMPIDIFVTNSPVVPIFENTDNLLRLIDEMSLMDNLELEWYFEGELLEGETNTSLCAENSGNYTLLFRDAGSGCESEFSEFVTINPNVINCNISNINQLSINNLQLYPNPVSNQLSVSFEAMNHRRFKVELINSMGQLITQTIWEGGGTHLIDMSVLPSSWYVLKLIEGNKVQSFKVLKQ